eukprot:2961471-Alexandrium_andersonii.AAC.1
MSASLVGSEMCIRDSAHTQRFRAARVRPKLPHEASGSSGRASGVAQAASCLLYTSDAADDM